MNERTSMAATLAVTAAALMAAGQWVSWKSHQPQATARDTVRRTLQNPAAVLDAVTYYPRTGATCGVIQLREGDGRTRPQGNFVLTPDGSLQIDPPSLLDPSGRLTRTASDGGGFRHLVASHCPGF